SPGGAPVKGSATLGWTPGRNTNWTSLCRCLVAATTALAGSLFGQGNSNGAPGRLSLLEDWSHHHVVFSLPGSPQALATIQKDLRYQHQLLKRAQSAAGTKDPKNKRTPPPPTGDWSLSMGRAGSSVAPAMFPAKFTFDVNSTPSCANDFAVFPEKDPGFARATFEIVLG